MRPKAYATRPRPNQQTQPAWLTSIDPRMSTHVSSIPVYEKGNHLVGIGVTLRATCSQARTPMTKVSI
jgi:hypothetical protein